MIAVEALRLNTLRFDPEQCINCRMCVIVCPHGVFESGCCSVGLVHPEACMECGACQVNCPTGAIAVNSGVGCASAMIHSALTGKTEVVCGCEADFSCCGESEVSGRASKNGTSCCGG